METVAELDPSGAQERSTLDEICREGARRMLAASLELEADLYVEALAEHVDGNGHRLVVRNGHARERKVTTVAGAVAITAPRVNDQRVDPDTGERCQFKSSIVPPWARKSPKVTEVLPLLYLHGLSTGDFAPALEQFFGSAAGLSASAVGRLMESWQAEHRDFAKRSLADRDFVYVWVDGVHFNVRLEEAKLCCLVMIGVRLDGTKELVAVKDGYRESTESWADLLRDLKRRGMRQPVLAVGDGALGFWSALKDVWPETDQQRCWFHKNRNVLAALPKTAWPTAKLMLAEINTAEDKDRAREAVARFTAEYGAKFPNAVSKIVDDQERLLAFYDYPPSTGSISRPRTRSSRRSPPSGSATRSPKVPGHAPRAWRWPTSSPRSSVRAPSLKEANSSRPPPRRSPRETDQEIRPTTIDCSSSACILSSPG